MHIRAHTQQATLTTYPPRRYVHMCARALCTRVRMYVCGAVCAAHGCCFFKRSGRATRVLHGGREVWSVDGGGSARVVGFVPFASGATPLSLL